MSEEWDVGNHFLVGKLITLRQLYNRIQHEHSAVGFGVEDKNVLKFALLLVHDDFYLQAKLLACR